MSVPTTITFAPSIRRQVASSATTPRMVPLSCAEARAGASPTPSAKELTSTQGGSPETFRPSVIGHLHTQNRASPEIGIERRARGLEGWGGYTLRLAEGPLLLCTSSNSPVPPRSLFDDGKASLPTLS